MGDAERLTAGNMKPGDPVKVGDLIRFPETGYTALVLEREEGTGAVRLLVTEEVQFKNPTWMGWRDLARCAEVVNSSE